MTAPALKIKAFMGTIKEACFDVGNGDPFESLLQMELVLRGVLPAAEKLWHQIQSSIGKPLVTMSSLPPPLLAGANVLAGRLAEAMEDETHNKIPIESSIVQRAKDISDMRWIILLQQTHFRDIARGYFCTAASIQIDTPPMWKKVWNTWGDEDAPVGKTPYEAQVAIENLIRIASEKGNTKRVAELQVRLVASYVNKERMTTSTVKIGKQEISVAQAFGDDFTKHLQLPANATFKAQQVIQQLHTNELSDVDKPWFPVVQWQVGIAQEDAIIESRALEQHKTNQNRSVASLLGTCRSKIRTNVYLEDLDPIHNTSLALRDSIARLWNQEKGDDSYWSPSLESFNDCLQRLRDRALAKIQDNISRDQDWRTLLDFILPLFQGLEESSKWNSDQEQNERISLLQKWIAQTSADEKTTISILALTFAQVCWMLLANGMDYSLDSDLYFVIDLLSVLIQYTAPQEWQTAVAVGATNQQVSQTQQWKEARSILVCVMGSPRIVEQITRDAVATKHQTDTSLGYLQCIVAWSGWYQRSWSFCANLSDVRRLLMAAQLSGGKRSLGTIERVLLELASADAELLNGGFPKEAEESFIKLLDILKEHADAMDSVVRAILESHCYNGLARVCRINNGRELARVHELAQRTLDLLADLKVPERVKPLYIWHDSSVFLMSISYQRCIARQLIADSLTSRGQMGEARSFLEVAVEDAPQDAGAALALGAFLLRVAFYMEEERYPDSAKVAQVQLLKAAKLDPTQADPFALLGVWFEESGDSNRAIGCYTKSLALDPCHPIAGRGLLRLKARESIKNELDIAIDMNSPVSGWAWRARGLEAEAEFAVVALLKALRSRDISAPENEYLGIFYQPPDVGYVNDRADALADLAACYRRLARFTASIRAYHASIESAGEHTSSAVLCACAQVELELSLFDDAVEKFERVLLREEGSSHSIAAYGKGVALYFLARRDLEDGKVGSAMSRIQRGIESCENFSVSFGCCLKLLGDLYSFGALLPLDLFHFGSEDKSTTAICNQVEFVRKGASAYRSFLELLAADNTPISLRASAACDVGSNILLQAQLREFVPTEKQVTEYDILYEKAREEFAAALELDPLHAPAWCGLGCSVLSKEPLLAQHAFSRCLQIEQMFPDAYANMGFLYTSKRAFRASESILNALTQVADTPMMWMNRAFILERNAKSRIEHQSKAMLDLSQAADAYRAAMQVMKHPESQLGLAMTCRVLSDRTLGIDRLEDQRFRKDGLSYAREYNGRFWGEESPLSPLEGIMTLEQVAGASHSTSWSKEALEKGETLILKGRGDLNLEPIKGSASSGLDVCCGEKKYSNAISFPVTITLQRQILHEPYRPDLWLRLAKELVISPDPSSTVDAANIAALRAAKMLTDELVVPQRHQSQVDPLESARNLSDALALVFWFGSRISAVCNDCSNDERKGTKERGGTTSFALERALMIDPTNKIAREALQLLS